MNNISCYNKEGKLEHFPVPIEVYIYLRQLECAIAFPDKSEIKETYSFRFGEDNDCNT